MLDKNEISSWLSNLQTTICKSLEDMDSEAVFISDKWERTEGGGGNTRVLADGKVFEKAGVAFSAIHGEVPAFLKTQSEHSLTGKMNAANSFFATGVSLVIHPQNPNVPIVHMNIRFFSTDNGIWWFGGGIDLTPIYVNKADANFFHMSLKKVCDQYDSTYYPKFKKWADDYFYIKHRNETRGIGGIFFDTLNSNVETEIIGIKKFWEHVGQSFIPIYSEIVNKNKDLSFTEQQKNWQLLRRGRYVEFNLVYDRGTKFGLETGGRVESILMSLPKHASWQYNFKTEPNSEEEKTLSYLRKGINWSETHS
jgi:coproporphyrinogen III oxidase